MRVRAPFGDLARPHPGTRIELPERKPHTVENRFDPSLPERFEVRFNSLGLRGPEPPPAGDPEVRMFAVGGSTTFCHFLPDERTWPSLVGERLGVWMNNAGFDGHSSEAHAVLLEDHLLALEPDVVLFLVGVNDMAKSDFTPVRFVARVDGPLDRVARSSALLSGLLHVVRMRSEREMGVMNFPLFDLRRHAADTGPFDERTEVDTAKLDAEPEQPSPDEAAELPAAQTHLDLAYRSDAAAHPDKHRLDLFVPAPGAAAWPTWNASFATLRQRGELTFCMDSSCPARCKRC